MPPVPAWLKKKIFITPELFITVNAIREARVHTVCEGARCPNRSECFSKGHATFMILGDRCTRQCSFCSVSKFTPRNIDTDEPQRIATLIRRLGLKYAVITSVTRDDLEDGGASHFADTIRAIKAVSGETAVEVLVPDFGFAAGSLKKVVETQPEVFGHNIETVKRLYPHVRPQADYHRSLSLLKEARFMNSEMLIKSGLMVGLGESEDEICNTLGDLREAGCDMVTIGQYLKSDVSNAEVQRFVSPEEFLHYEGFGRRLGLKHVKAGTFVRSSYCAHESYRAVKEAMHDECGIAAVGRGR